MSKKKNTKAMKKEMRQVECDRIRVLIAAQLAELPSKYTYMMDVDDDERFNSLFDPKASYEQNNHDIGEFVDQLGVYLLRITRTVKDLYDAYVFLGKDAYEHEKKAKKNCKKFIEYSTDVAEGLITVTDLISRVSSNVELSVVMQRVAEEYALIGTIGRNLYSIIYGNIETYVAPRDAIKDCQAKYYIVTKVSDRYSRSFADIQNEEEDVCSCDEPCGCNKDDEAKYINEHCSEVILGREKPDELQVIIDKIAEVSSKLLNADTYMISDNETPELLAACALELEGIESSLRKISHKNHTFEHGDLIIDQRIMHDVDILFQQIVDDQDTQESYIVEAQNAVDDLYDQWEKLTMLKTDTGNDFSNTIRAIADRARGALYETLRLNGSIYSGMSELDELLFPEDDDELDYDEVGRLKILPKYYIQPEVELDSGISSVDASSDGVAEVTTHDELKEDFQPENLIKDDEPAYDELNEVVNAETGLRNDNEEVSADPLNDIASISENTATSDIPQDIAFQLDSIDDEETDFSVDED